MLFRVEALAAANASFGRLRTPCGTEEDKVRRRCSDVDSRPYWVADWGMAWQLIRRGVRPVCVAADRALSSR